MKKSGCLLILTLIFVGHSAEGAFEDFQSGIRAQGMGGAFTAVCDDQSAVQWNPAGLLQTKTKIANFSAKRLYNIKGLNNLTANLVWPTQKLGHLALALQQTGCELEHDQSFTFTQAFNLTGDLSFGYNLIAYRLWQERFGSALAFGVDLGFLATVYRRFRLGCFGHNLNNPKLGKIARYDLPQFLELGISYRPFSGVVSSFDLYKEVGYSTVFKAGQEFTVIEKYLVLRAGVQGAPAPEPVRYALGFGSDWKKIHFNYAYQSHPVLSGTHQVGVGYEF
ncbi:MAG: hypothetical protein AB1393_05355 [Candidatus Edwardsbacteria bacterium]